MPLYIVYINREPDGRATLRSIRLTRANERDVWDTLPASAEHATVIEASSAHEAAELRGIPLRQKSFTQSA